MAKPEPVEDFDITVHHVPKEKVGDLASILTKMGYANIDFNLVTTEVRFNRKATHDINAADFLKGWIPDHPTFRAKEAVTHFDLHGRSAGAAYSALRALTDEGVLKAMGNGNYARKDVKHLAPPAKKAAVKKAAVKKTSPKNEVSHHAFIMKKAARSGHFSRDKAMEWLKDDGRQPTSVGPTISTLLKKSLIERVSEGEYKLLSPPPAKGNGAAQVEVNHG